MSKFQVVSTDTDAILATFATTIPLEHLRIEKVEPKYRVELKNLEQPKPFWASLGVSPLTRDEALAMVQKEHGYDLGNGVSGKIAYRIVEL